jgi:hypothetical protein
MSRTSASVWRPCVMRSTRTYPALTHAALHTPLRPQSAPSACSLRRGQVPAAASTLAVPAPNPAQRPSGHTALLHGLGAVGKVAPAHLPRLLRLAHIHARHLGGDSSKALQVIDLAPAAWLSGRPCEALLPLYMCTLGVYHRSGTRASRNHTCAGPMLCIMTALMTPHLQSQPHWVCT